MIEFEERVAEDASNRLFSGIKKHDGGGPNKSISRSVFLRKLSEQEAEVTGTSI